ncbi:MAG TPA: tetratricopeptide repeat protein [bacterium]
MPVSFSRRAIFFCGAILLFAIAQPVLPADNEADYADYIASLQNLPAKDFSSILIAELHEYIRRFPDATNLDDMHFKMASIFSDNKNQVESFFAHLQLIYFYPNSKHLVVAQDRLRTLLIQDNKFRAAKDKVETLLNPTIFEDSKEGRRFNFLRDAHEYNLEPIAKLVINSCDQFLRDFPESPKSEEVRFWEADLLARDQQFERSLAEYLKVTYLHKQGLLVTASKLKMADLFTERLKMHQNAILTLEEFLLEFPDDPQAPYAQLRLAKILEQEKRTYVDAINAYTAVAKRYPASVEAVPALFDAARLYEDKFKEYDQAIRVYTEIVRDFPKDLKAPYALAEAARVYEKRLSDYFNAASVYYKVYGLYPESQIAAASLYAAAEIHEKRLKDLQKAIEHYRLIVDKFPNDDLAAKASGRIEKLSKELNK